MILQTIVLAFCATLCSAIINEPSVYRPCNLRNIDCIRNDLRSNSRCQPPPGVAPAVLVVPRARFDTPAFNASYEDTNMLVRGLDRCFVSEYYAKRGDRGRFVAVDCPWLSFESNRIMYQHYLRREDGIYRYAINGSYPLITVHMPMLGNSLDLCTTFPNVHVHALPTFNIKPLDRPTQNHLTRDLAALGVYEQETFAARAQLLARSITNNLLCNFGCN